MVSVKAAILTINFCYLTPFGQHLTGHEEHAARVASISLGMVLLIVIPSLLLVVCGASYWIRERIAKEEAEAAAALLPKRPKRVLRGNVNGSGAGNANGNGNGIANEIENEQI
ncbi:hypothetical protein AWZ03_001149 [Drosophila navojoa]|uniref:Uncharacterized protein n=1 Tax=Drosophila navojoa TaxID=7232 RepID=A0A484BU33_DRONA|nr:hypothetical protein AWZ03_001149 [Drosophila navojoa]